ncbi:MULTISPECIES: hypothetical protein [Methylobacterium]|jgi:hypothetical protein|uniref:hypothetical protein n=1 Tax=Methylobacterium TaxID=407 RepID=UPI0012ED0219|nr:MULTISPECIES: hypothetical protein [Methylobacterium]NGM37292.1 hypothetical protein [Methylobacterium sp. DB0501]UHC20354.1 hypothetical protein LRS73_34495 [Methylobacterium currus]
MIRAAFLSATLFLTAVGSARAEKLSLPVGDWAYSPVSPTGCKRPSLTIEKDRLIQRIDQEAIRGEARCKILKIRRQGRGIVFIDTKCDWDAHIPQGMRESPDNENDDSFSLKFISPKKILFNNSEHELCARKSEGGR